MSEYFLATTINSLHNVPLNSDMEVNSNWSLIDSYSAGGSHFLTNSFATEGSYSRKIAALGKGVGIVSDSFSLVSNQNYSLSFDIYAYNNLSVSGDVGSGTGIITTTYRDGRSVYAHPSQFNTGYTQQILGRQAGSYYYEQFMLFSGITFPQSVNITSAKLRVVSQGPNAGVNSGGLVLSEIFFASQDSAAAPSNTNSFEAVPLTSNYVSWTIYFEPDGTSWSVDSEYFSPDLSVPLQEVVDRPNRPLNSNVLLMWLVNSDQLSDYSVEVYHYQSSSYLRPQLLVDWSEPGSVLNVQSKIFNLKISNANGSGFSYDGSFVVNENEYTSIDLSFFEENGGDAAQVILTHAESNEADYFIDNMKLYSVHSDSIQIYPLNDYRRQTEVIKDDHRNLSGTLFSYKWGSFETFKFTLDYVALEKATKINSWWSDNKKMLFTITSGGVLDTTSVMFLNKKAPMLDLVKPYDEYLKGTLELSTY